MKLALLTIALLFFSFSDVLAQLDVPYSVKTVNYVTRKKEAGVSVRVLDGGSVFQTGTTDGSGESKFVLKSGKKYKIEVSKAGKVSRSIIVNLVNVNDESVPGNSKIEGAAEISLFDEVADVDYSYVTSNPITEFYFDGKKTELQYDEVLAEKMAKKIEKIMKDAESKSKDGDAKYNELITQADGLATAKKYEDAIKIYEMAQIQKPKEKYPADKITELSAFVKAQKSAGQANAQLEADYKNLITAGDALRDQKKYDEALARYEEALTKKQEQYPKDQVVIVKKAIADAAKEAENKTKYDAALKAADGFFAQKSWMAAKDKYKEALKWKANDPVATAKLADIETKLNAQKADQEKKKKYEDAIAAGDQFFKDEKFADAKLKYNEAITFESAATYPKEKIKEIEGLNAQAELLKAKQGQIDKLISEGNTAFTANQFVPAKSKFQEVLKLDPTNAVALAKIADIDAKILSEKADAEKIAKAKALVLEGDALAKTSKNVEARAKYVEAQAIKNEPAVQAKIDAIDAKLNAQTQKEEQKKKFEKALVDGDALVAANNFEGAKAKYLEASALDATSAIPKQKIAEVDKKIAQNQASADKTSKYTAAFNAGVSAFDSKDYALAKTKLQEAIAIDNTKQEAKDKLSAVEKLLAENAAQSANKAKYDAAIKAGSDLQTAGKLTEAKTKYTEASKLDPSQTLPSEKIKEIDSALAKLEKDKQIATLLTEGGAALTKKDLPTARSKYQKVIDVDPSNAIAAAKLLEVSKLENDLSGEAEKKAKFLKLKQEGTDLFTQAKYNEAKQKLNEAKSIQTDAQVDKLIIDCDKKLADLEGQAQKDKNYLALLNEGKTLEASKKYEEAIAKFNEAIKIKNEQEPKDRIAAINALKQNSTAQAKLDADFAAAMKRGGDALATSNYPDALKGYNDALALKPTDATAIAKRKEVEELSKASTRSAEDEQYQKILSFGQKAIDEKNYSKAKEMYNRALSFRASDPLPTQKIAEIDELIKAEKDKQGIVAAYQKKMAEAETTAKSGNLEAAIAQFEQAKTIKSDETLPEQRIGDLRNQIAAKSSSSAEIEAKYKAAMDAGNSSAVSKDFQSALSKYNAALAVKPKDKVATEKAAEMKLLLDSQSAASKKEAEIKAMLEKADAKFALSNWKEAKVVYEQVLAIDGSNDYAKGKSVECDKKMQDAGVNEAEIQYQKILTKADDNFGIKDYDKAKDLYKRALKLKPADAYPKRKLAEIEALLNPTPVKPVIVSVPTEPTALPSLGTQTDNSISDAQKRLEKASNTRKGRNGFRVRKKLENITDSETALKEKQLSTTTEADQKLATIQKENNANATISTEKQNENVELIEAKDKQIIEESLESETIKNKLLLDQKSQLELANTERETQNELLNGSSVQNAEFLKNNQAGSVKGNDSLVANAYNETILNDVKYTDIKIKIENDQNDDFEERKAIEGIVLNANNSVIKTTEENKSKSDKNTVEIKDQINTANKTIELQDIEDKRQAPMNQKEMIQIEKVINDQQVDDKNQQIKTTQVIKDELEKTDKTIAEFNLESTLKQNDNEKQIISDRKSKDELDRADYNQGYEKSLTNKQAIQTELVTQDELNSLPSAVGEANTAEFNKIYKEKDAQASVDAKNQKEKTEDNQGSLNQTKTTVEKSNTVGNDKSSTNAESIKATQNGLGDAETKQLAEKNAENLEAKRLLDAIDKREIVYTDKVANDLGKLYPEGVSQEQFDQNGQDGLVSAVVTRRIVVKGGHGDVYVRTQTIDGITFSKNGQPTTETTWQRETQSALLKRNY